jgi:hypothetical protein
MHLNYVIRDCLMSHASCRSFRTACLACCVPTSRRVGVHTASQKSNRDILTVLMSESTLRVELRPPPTVLR